MIESLGYNEKNSKKSMKHIFVQLFFITLNSLSCCATYDHKNVVFTFRVFISILLQKCYTIKSWIWKYYTLCCDQGFF
jgi:hypothetical protein